MVPTKTILVIDDDEAVRSSLEVVLLERGYQVLTAENGHHGIELARVKTPCLVISDMMMPEQSGFVVLETLKRSRKPSKFIMITANGGEHHRNYADHLGADAYFQKPFAIADLLACVEELCPLN
jgi:DNA-binding response OmpR family regulator